jgi:hypothetical protein
MITIASNGDILVGGSDGYVAFSKDGGDSFTRIIDKTDTRNVYVVADKDYADNNIIYIAAGDEVERGAADKDKTWASREPDELSDNVTGIAQYGDAIYVMTCNGTDSRLYRALKLKTADNAAKALWSYLDADDELYNTLPQALKVSSGPKLWMIDTDSPDLESCKDPIAATPPTLLSPADGYVVPMNMGTGQAYNVTFSWERYDYHVEEMDLQIATDSKFDGVIYTGNFDISALDTDTVAKSVGPTGSTSPENMQVDYTPGATYYWRVRVSSDGPLYSPWSASRSFKIESQITFNIVSPETGATGVSTTPTFTWTDYPDAIGYEVMVAEDPTFGILDMSHTADNTFYQVKDDEALAYATTYYWRVRGVTGPAPAKGAAPGGPCINGIFTTMAEPKEEVPPVIVEKEPAPPPQVVQVPVPGPVVQQPIPNAVLWAIVAIGAVLIIALIVLIVRTRRVA